ncbi:MAG: metallophosphoesterase [Desulfurococcus sp.]|nr:metallophosphoesterase [Desulfurococcus sp.]
MLVGVISDTHDNISATRRVINELLKQGVELVIHLGDVVSPFTLKYMREAAGNLKFIIIKGNNDGDVYMLSKLSESYGWRFYDGLTIIELDGRRILAMHGYGDTLTVEGLVNSLAGSTGVDGVLYGHTHRARLEHVGGKLILNPGEVCGYLTGRSTYGLIDTRTMKANIITLES